jgi:hypothetical protein
MYNTMPLFPFNLSRRIVGEAVDGIGVMVMIPARTTLSVEEAVIVFRTVQNSPYNNKSAACLPPIFITKACPK